MKFFKIIYILVLSLGLALFFASCGESGSKSEGVNMEESPAKEEAHSHEDGHNHGHGAEQVGHGEGQAYTAAYVCMMHCEGSGSDAPGKCPVCNMDYVAQADHVADGHTHEE